MNWKALKEVPSGEHGFPRGNCESCGLYLWSEGAYKITGIKGYSCCVLCFECHLFGNGKCRWCGTKLDSAKKWCTDSCRNQSSSIKFGDGTRLLNYLARYHPTLYKQLTAKGCGHCGDPLTGKRQGATFCSNRCTLRSRREARKAALSVSSAQKNQQVGAVKSKSGVLAHVG